MAQLRNEKCRALWSVGALFRFHPGPRMPKNPDFHVQMAPEAPPKIFVVSKSAWVTSFDSLEVP